MLTASWYFSCLKTHRWYASKGIGGQCLAGDGEGDGRDHVSSFIGPAWSDRPLTWRFRDYHPHVKPKNELGQADARGDGG